MWTCVHNGACGCAQTLQSCAFRLFAIPGTVAHQAPLSMGFSRQEYWSGLPFPSPGDLPNPGIEPRSSLEGGFPGHWCYLGSPYAIVRGQKRKEIWPKFIKALDGNMKNLVFMPQIAIFIMVVLDSEAVELIFEIPLVSYKNLSFFFSSELKFFFFSLFHTLHTQTHSLLWIILMLT